ncbi:MAG: dTDP-4-dehydrorhamnose reductase [Deltaproteobacteria bacterium]|nr:dTDP-4-dehydrorhamnose reductase [Deltaproteobacteria bacterium]MBW2687477.1 dTDP-4-dehydrorhamnose reductase [Deltaproteobacteria bacterium]
MSDIVVIGADGMLGRCWSELLTSRNIDHMATTVAELDITDQSALEHFVTPGTQWVVNCAAYTLVDAAEEHEDLANEVNGHAVGRMAQRCKAVGARLLHYSTDYVFDGTATLPYATDHPRSAVNAYGRSKALGEELIQRSGVEHLLVRSSWLYAPWGQNFVLTIRELAKARSNLRVVNDQRGRPTDSRKLAEVSLALAERGSRGIFHVTDGGECTWFDLAALIAEVVNPSCQVEPCASDEFPRPAPRPGYSVLDISATENVVGPLTPWEDRVRDVLARV